MTLTELLDIERKLLLDEDELGLAYSGAPVEPRALCRILERILRSRQREGVRNPAILLRRRKELERGTWALPSASGFSRGHSHFLPGHTEERMQEGQVIRLFALRTRNRF